MCNDVNSPAWLQTRHEPSASIHSRLFWVRLGLRKFTFEVASKVYRSDTVAWALSGKSFLTSLTSSHFLHPWVCFTWWKSDRMQKWLEINTAYISAAKWLFAFQISFGWDRAPQNNLNQFPHLNRTTPSFTWRSEALANWSTIMVPAYMLTSAHPYKTPRWATLALYVF